MLPTTNTTSRVPHEYPLPTTLLLGCPWTLYDKRRAPGWKFNFFARFIPLKPLQRSNRFTTPQMDCRRPPGGWWGGGVEVWTWRKVGELSTLLRHGQIPIDLSAATPEADAAFQSKGMLFSSRRTQPTQSSTGAETEPEMAMIWGVQNDEHGFWVGTCALILTDMPRGRWWRRCCSKNYARIAINGI